MDSGHGPDAESKAISYESSRSVECTSFHSKVLFILHSQRLSGGSWALKLSNQHHSANLVDAHTAWNHLDSLKWAQMVPNTRYCHNRQPGPLPRMTQIVYIRIHQSVRRSTFRTGPSWPYEASLVLERRSRKQYPSQYDFMPFFVPSSNTSTRV